MVTVLSLFLGLLLYMGCSYFADYVLEPFLEKKDHQKELARRARAKELQCQ